MIIDKQKEYPRYIPVDDDQVLKKDDVLSMRAGGIEHFPARKRFDIEGDDYLEKEVMYQSSSAGRIYLPASWIGKKVAVILLP